MDGPTNLPGARIEVLLQNKLKVISFQLLIPRLCSSRAWWPGLPNFCSRVTRKSKLFRRNHMLGTLYFASSEHLAPFNFF